jgi:hypothetical protein
VSAEAATSAATLPPETTTTTGPGAGATRLARVPRVPAAAGSATTLARSAARRRADLGVRDEHDVVHEVARDLVGERPGNGAESPSAIVEICSSETKAGGERASQRRRPPAPRRRCARPAGSAAGRSPRRR